MQSLPSSRHQLRAWQTGSVHIRSGELDGNFWLTMSDRSRCTAGPRFSPLQPFNFEGQLQRRVAGSRRLVVDIPIAPNGRMFKVSRRVSPTTALGSSFGNWSVCVISSFFFWAGHATRARPHASATSTNPFMALNRIVAPSHLSPASPIWYGMG